MVDFSSTPPDSTNNPVSETPENFEVPKDARKSKDAGKYPLYYSHKTRSGHVFQMDDSPGAESVTVQHRSGSSFQMMPDGAVVFTSKKGKYEVTFGESRMVVTGAMDTVVQGGGSLRVEGDYDMTVMGNVNQTVKGDYNMTAKNMNMAIRGNADMAVKGNQTTKVAGNSEHATEGRTVISGDGGIALGSSADSVGIQAAQAIGMKSGEALMIQSGGKSSIKAGGDVAMDGSNIHLNSGEADDAAFSYTKEA
jgi:hypothetical protein